MREELERLARRPEGRVCHMKGLAQRGQIRRARGVARAVAQPGNRIGVVSLVGWIGTERKGDDETVVPHGGRKTEVGGQHANDGPLLSVDTDLSPHDVGVSAKPCAPDAVAQDDDSRSTGRELGRIERASEARRESDGAKEVAAHAEAADWRCIACVAELCLLGAVRGDRLE
jgi:hypothetical protein